MIDKKILQREAVGGSIWLAVPAYLLLLAIVTAWLISLGRGLRRLENTSIERRRPTRISAAGGPTPAMR